MITSNVLNHLDDYKILTDCQHWVQSKKLRDTAAYIGSATGGRSLKD